MMRVIGGKRYDTETAAKIAEASSDDFVTDFRYWNETLYRKKTGEFFVFGEGGAMTQWSRSDESGNTIGGENVKPLTDAMAREWVEAHANEQYESIFGPAPE